VTFFSLKEGMGRDSTTPFSLFITHTYPRFVNSIIITKLDGYFTQEPAELKLVARRRLLGNEHGGAGCLCLGFWADDARVPRHATKHTCTARPFAERGRVVVPRLTFTIHIITWSLTHFEALGLFLSNVVS
jgi:hypothetical protein